MKFLFDVNIAKTMSDAIAIMAISQGIEVKHLSELVAPSTPDPTWIRQVQADGWVLISADRRISRSPANREAWRESGLTAFFLGEGWANHKFWVQAAELIRWFPYIADTARDCEPGSGFLLPFKGTEPKPIIQPRG